MISVSEKRRKPLLSFVDSGALALLCVQVSCMRHISKLSFSQKLVTFINSTFFCDVFTIFAWMSCLLLSQGCIYPHIQCFSANNCVRKCHHSNSSLVSRTLNYKKTELFIASFQELVLGVKWPIIYC